MKRENKNDVAWEKVFDHFDIVGNVDKNGIFEISADDIKQIGRREPRLMTKFDHKTDLPKLFSKNKLSILPNTRGTYVIGRFQAFSDLDYDPLVKPIKKEFPGWVHSLDPELITSESTALNIAHLTGMIDDVLGEDISHLTLSGRMKSGEFNFKIKTNEKGKYHNITVKNSQIEIDGGYESINYLGIIEAKNRVPNDFLVRQLYYPFSLFNRKLPQKIIKPIFFTYSQNIFSFHEFEFQDPDEYSSIKKVGQKDFVLAGLEDISIDDLADAYAKTSITPEPKDIPFPQADNFIRVLDLLSFLNVKDGRTRDEIARKYGFQPRQADYYFNSLAYLGMAERERGTRRRKLTPFGRKVAKEFSYKKKMLIFVEAILSKVVFRRYLEDYWRLGRRPGKERAKELIEEHIDDVGGDTISRRSSTVVSWVEWILKLQDM